MTDLRIARNLTLPADLAVVTKFAIVAMSGAGKSNAAVVLAEEFHTAGIPWVAIDPKGDWWGVRSNHSGTGPGLHVPVFGGLHGDVPLEPTAGKLIGNLIAERGLTCVLDVSEFDSKAQQSRFLTDLAETLLRRNRDPLHLFLEEADDYLPQRFSSRGGDVTAACVGAWQRLVKRGRFRGIGITLITQRSAALNKDALNQADTVIAMRVLAKRDRDAIGDWVENQPGLEKAIVETLHELEDGEAWIWSPQRLKITERVRFRRRRTFDSGATPLVGTSRTPATLADVDLDEIKAQMADTIARVEADDPAKLRRRIRELEGQLATAEKARPEPERIVETVEVRVPVLPKGYADATALMLEHARKGFEAASKLVDIATSLPEPAPEPTTTQRDTRSERARPAVTEQRSSERPARVAPPTPRPAARAGDTTATAKIGKRERAILTVLAQYSAGRTQRQIALLTGYSVKASTISAGLSELRKAGYVTPKGKPSATPEGIEWLGDDLEPLPTGPALLAHWRAELGERERRLLDALLDVYPESSTLHELAEITGYSAGASTISAGMSKLRGLEIVTGWRVSDDFMDAISAPTITH